jgi:hypothetical protein
MLLWYTSFESLHLEIHILRLPWSSRLTSYHDCWSYYHDYCPNTKYTFISKIGRGLRSPFSFILIRALCNWTSNQVHTFVEFISVDFAIQRAGFRPLSFPHLLQILSSNGFQ